VGFKTLTNFAVKEVATVCYTETDQVVRENRKFLIPEGFKHQYFTLAAGM